jgi:hypothetical protein
MIFVRKDRISVKVGHAETFLAHMALGDFLQGRTKRRNTPVSLVHLPSVPRESSGMKLSVLNHTFFQSCDHFTF